LVKPTYDTPYFWPFLYMYFATFSPHQLQLTIMPEFVPTEWMLDNHRDKGEDDWQIYAECVREAICKQGNFQKCDRPIRDKLHYENFMRGEKNEVEIDGKTYYYPPSRENETAYMAVKSNNSQSDDEEKRQ